MSRTVGPGHRPVTPAASHSLPRLARILTPGDGAPTGHGVGRGGAGTGRDDDGPSLARPARGGKVSHRRERGCAVGYHPLKRNEMPGNRCDECGTKINRLTTPYKFKHGSHTHAFCDPP
jgi:hypothetical protein